MNEDNHIIFDAINTFYKLKSTYEKQEETVISNLMSNNALSVKEKRKKYKNHTYTCVNCGRDGGTTFMVDIVDDCKNLIAMCGNQDEQCELFIDITFPGKTPAQDYIDKTINAYRLLTRTKYDLVFGIINAHAGDLAYNNLKIQVESLNQKYEHVLNDKQKFETENADNDNAIVSIKDAIQKTILEIKQNIGDGNVANAVDTYINTLMQLTKALREKTYMINDVDTKDNIHSLVQTLHHYDDSKNIYCKPVLNSFIYRGIDHIKTRKDEIANETNTDIIIDKRQKTRKNKSDSNNSQRTRKQYHKDIPINYIVNPPKVPDYSPMDFINFRPYSSDTDSSENVIEYYFNSHQYYELGNFALINDGIEIDSLIYPSIEHAYQAQTFIPEHRHRFTTDGDLGDENTGFNLVFDNADDVKKKWINKKRNNIGIIANKTADQDVVLSLGLTKLPSFLASNDLWLDILRKKFNLQYFKNLLVKTENKYLLDYDKTAKNRIDNGQDEDEVWGGFIDYESNKLYGQNQHGGYLMIIRDELIDAFANRHRYSD